MERLIIWLGIIIGYSASCYLTYFSPLQGSHLYFFRMHIHHWIWGLISSFYLYMSFRTEKFYLDLDNGKIENWKNGDFSFYPKFLTILILLGITHFFNGHINEAFCFLTAPIIITAAYGNSNKNNKHKITAVLLGIVLGLTLEGFSSGLYEGFFNNNWTTFQFFKK